METSQDGAEGAGVELWMRADFAAARGGEIHETASWEESDVDGEQDGAGMEGDGGPVAPAEDGRVGANGTERGGTGVPRVAGLWNDEADEEAQLQAAWLEEIEEGGRMAVGPTEYEEELEREWFADEHEEGGNAFGDG